MTILNLMLGKRRGGLEQAALDYAEALQHAGHQGLTITSPGAWVATALGALPQQSLRNAGAWDPLAAWNLRRLAKAHGATAIVCHGNRALGLALRALKGRVPVIATAHNYKTKRFVEADAAFCITQQAVEHLADLGMPREKLFFMPNMVRLPVKYRAATRHEPPVIGSMGRFVAKKGFPLFIDALSILNQRGIAFRGVIGGGGPDEALLREHITATGMDGIVTLAGWVEDKYRFLDGIDLFVLPSHHEPFGIVLIEAMGYALPVVSTRSEGPIEIIADGVDGRLVPLNDASAIADAMAAMLADSTSARTMAGAARSKVARDYSLDAMAGRLKAALLRITSPA